MVASDSFFVAGTMVAPFIEPSFSKTEFPKEHPSILIVSAVGASGKTTTARALSFQTQLPILDLASHKAVGDNSLTGLLTTAYPVEGIGQVLEGLRKGTHGIIIDGLDEARSKTTEQGFQAFLDDVINRSKGASATAVVMFGRGEVLLTTWCYLADKDADVGLVSIDPFDLQRARTYIDAQVPERNASQQDNYEKARDSILHRLGSAFSRSATDGQDAFLTFVGYPPVLDAIGTLLREEPNYHGILQAFGDDSEGPVEIDLLIRICEYLLRRERDNKALPNFIESIAADADPGTGHQLRQSLYGYDEQCARVLSRALKRPFARRLVQDRALNERYEKAVDAWCPDHPFLDNGRLRNAVFAATAVTRCALSDVPEYRDLGLAYAEAHRPTFHLLYIMEALGNDGRVDVRCFNMLMQSCSEFLGTAAAVSVSIEGASWEDVSPDELVTSELAMTIDFPERQQERTFRFSATGDSTGSITLGPSLICTDVSLPCHVELLGRPALDVIGACSIAARSIRIDASDLSVRGMARSKNEDERRGLIIDAQRVEGHAGTVSLGGGGVEIQCCEHDLDYPLARFVHTVAEPIPDAGTREKYLRLRRILMEFRSHKKGRLAKYRDKIEHERVVRNDQGRAVLAMLVREGVLVSDTKFYYVDQDSFAQNLGTTWQDLRQHKASEQLKRFLERVK